MKQYSEMSNRERIEAFIKYNFKDDELEYISTVTKEMEPKLRYSLVDRYGVKVKSSKYLKKFIRFANSFFNVEIYAELGILNVGYIDASITPAVSTGAQIKDSVGVA